MKFYKNALIITLAICCGDNYIKANFYSKYYDQIVKLGNDAIHLNILMQKYPDLFDFFYKTTAYSYKNYIPNQDMIDSIKDFIEKNPTISNNDTLKELKQTIYLNKEQIAICLNNMHAIIYKLKNCPIERLEKFYDKLDKDLKQIYADLQAENDEYYVEKAIEEDRFTRKTVNKLMETWTTLEPSDIETLGTILGFTTKKTGNTVTFLTDMMQIPMPCQLINHSSKTIVVTTKNGSFNLPSHKRYNIDKPGQLTISYGNLDPIILDPYGSRNPYLNVILIDVGRHRFGRSYMVNEIEVLQGNLDQAKKDFPEIQNYNVYIPTAFFSYSSK